MKFIKIAPIAALLLIWGCKQTTKKPETPQAPVVHQDSIKAVAARFPQFNADSAYYFIEKQVSFGPRVPGTMGHSACAKWLRDKLKQYCDTVLEQNFSATTWDKKRLNLKNIIGIFNPQAEKRILLCAHWDTRPIADNDTARRDEPIPGANDGASGVGVLLEIARLLAENRPQTGVDIIFFDGEDWGNPGISDSYCLGSQYFAKNPHVKDYQAEWGVLLDMVGAENAQFAMEEFSLTFARNTTLMLWRTAHELGYGVYFPYGERGAITDDHYYLNTVLGVPTVDIINFSPRSNSSFGDFWHTHGDNMSIISRSTLKAVGQTVLVAVLDARLIQ